MADLFGNSNSSDNFDLGSTGNSDKIKTEEIQKVIMMEQQKAQLNAQVKHRCKRFFPNDFYEPNVFFQIQEISEICWEKCVDKPSAKLGGKSEVCISNCVKRFFDTSVIIAHRFNQLLQRSNTG